MASSGVNVLRWSALFTGVVYGLYHQSAISAKSKINQIDAEFQHQSTLIQKAKAEWAKKTMPQDSKTTAGGVISDPSDPKFDLETYLTKMADEAK